MTITVFKTYKDVESVLIELQERNQQMRERCYERYQELENRFTDIPNKKEQQESWEKASEGLEFTYAIGLSEYNGGYNFESENPQAPVEYATIEELVGGVREYLVQESTRHLRATVNPMFYTILEKKTMGKEEKEGLEESRRELENIKDDELGDEEKKMMQEFISVMLDYANVPIRGLNVKERRRFEKLFYESK